MKAYARILSLFLCVWLPHAPLSAVTNQTPSGGINNSASAVVVWCNENAHTIETSTLSGVSWSPSPTPTTLSSGNGAASHPQTVMHSSSGFVTAVWIEVNPTDGKNVVYGSFYSHYGASPTTYVWSAAQQISTSGHDVVPEDLMISTNSVASGSVSAIVSWSEYVDGDRVICGVIGSAGVVGSLLTPPSWGSPIQGPN